MFIKLLRLEAKLTSRIFLPLMGAVTALSGLAMLAVQLAGPDALIVTGGPMATAPAPHNKILSMVMGFLALSAFFSMAALMVTSVLVTAQRFYKNLLGDEGYLMFTLPATPGEHLAAKLAVGVGWSAASLVLVLALTAAIVGSIRVTLPGGQTALSLALAYLRQDSPLPLWQSCGVGALLFLTGTCFAYLLIYFSMVLGAQQGGWPHSRLGRSILAYVVLQVLISLLEVGAAWLAGQLRLDPLQGLGEGGQFLIASAWSAAIFIAGSLAWFFAVRWLLEKRLNLI